MKTYQIVTKLCGCIVSEDQAQGSTALEAIGMVELLVLAKLDSIQKLLANGMLIHLTGAIDFSFEARSI